MIVGNYKAPVPKEKRSDWYHGTLDRAEAISLLRKNGDKDGTFLVRFSDRRGGTYVLTIMYHCQDFHYQIQKKVTYILLYSYNKINVYCICRLL